MGAKHIYLLWPIREGLILEKRGNNTPRLPDLLSALVLKSLRPAARLRARVSVWGDHAVSTVLVLQLLIPTAAYPTASAGPRLTDDEIEEAIAAVAKAPLSNTPLRLRKAALETLSPFAVPATPAGGEDDERPPVLPVKLLTLLAEDNALYFVDEGRISNAIVLRHDRTLAKALVDLLDHDRVTRAAQEAYLDGLVLILLADRHIVELALADARVILGGTGAAAPDLATVEQILRPYLESGRQTGLGDAGLDRAIGLSLGAGSAYQALGNLDIATRWYQIGQYGWRGRAHWHEGDIATLGWLDREGPAIWQQAPAICAALAGNTPRAEQLFTWIAQNRAKTDLELQAEEKAHNYQSIWQSLGFELFARTWLGDQWERVLRLAEVGRRVVEKTRRAGHPKDFPEPQLLIDIGWSVSSYFIHPDEASKAMAIKSLTLEKIPDRDTRTRSNMLGYLFALRHRYPEIDPYQDELFTNPAWRPPLEVHGPPPAESEFQSELDALFHETEHAKKDYVVVSSIGLHLRVGAYPGKTHRLRLCCDVMRRNMLRGDWIVLQSPPDNLLAIHYRIPRPQEIRLMHQHEAANLRSAGDTDFAAPQAGDALSPESARQAADLFQKWAARQGVTLDRTPESLKVLDALLRPSYDHAPDEEARAGMIFLWGSYFSEVLREELAGGQWDFEDKDRLGAGLVWDMGVGELRLLPYKHVLQILTGKTDQSRYDLWQETEQAYVDMG